MRIVLVRHGNPNYEKDCLTEKPESVQKKTEEANEAVQH